MSKVTLSEDKDFLADMDEFDAMDLPSSPALRASFSTEGSEQGDAAAAKSPDHSREYSRHSEHSQVIYQKEAYERSHGRGHGYAKLHSREGTYTKVYGKSI
jgi:hypothetical protein